MCIVASRCVFTAMRAIFFDMWATLFENMIFGPNIRHTYYFCSFYAARVEMFCTFNHPSCDKLSCVIRYVNDNMVKFTFASFLFVRDCSLTLM